MWVPLLAVEEPGWPEKLYPADRVVVVVPPEEDEGSVELRDGASVCPEVTRPGGIRAQPLPSLDSCTGFSQITP